METPYIPGYRIEQAIGKGAMSTVFLGVQESLERRVVPTTFMFPVRARTPFHQTLVQ